MTPTQRECCLVSENLGTFPALFPLLISCIMHLCAENMLFTSPSSCMLSCGAQNTAYLQAVGSPSSSWESLCWSPRAAVRGVMLGHGRPPALWGRPQHAVLNSPAPSTSSASLCVCLQSQQPSLGCRRLSFGTAKLLPVLLLLIGSFFSHIDRRGLHDLGFADRFVQPQRACGLVLTC